MLSLYSRRALQAVGKIQSSVRLNSTNKPTKWKIEEKTENDTTTVSMQPVQDSSQFRSESDVCSLCTCNVPVKVSYKDVLILEQFMRDDGTVLPKELTGLCKNQQLRVERCVMQAHWSGLFGSKYGDVVERKGYYRFNRYWNDDMAMYRLETKKVHGTWYYIKRYPTKNNAIFKNPIN
ncbi:unnamed protein product [Caenorhabditis bovis]|uniref:Uncharacterized protein n=1 Tax=Caenorhabditis bovis TaxID=2654633 RepID=A0A8S1ETU0_9PELO|nr:unnamed protein product [Caenorhabditis bovis]